MKLVTTDEMRRIERAADEAGLSYAQMMDHAGRAVAEVVQQRFGGQARIVVLVGPGNNGGDGLVAARYLREWGHRVGVYIWKRDKPDDPNLSRVQEKDIAIHQTSEDTQWTELSTLVQTCDVLIDALLGTGVTGPLRGTLRELLKRVQQTLNARQEETIAESQRLQHVTDLPARSDARSPLIVAVDVPSGLNCDTGEIDDLSLSADVTVTFAYPKRGHFLFPGAGRVGELVVADIGIAPALAEAVPTEVITAQDVARLMPARPADSHKGTYGKAMIVAGSANYVGAPCLAAEAAGRAGAGLVTAAIPEAIYPIVAGKITEATFLVLADDTGVLVPEALRVLAKGLAGYDALLVGPGLGREAQTGDFLCALITGGRGLERKAVGFKPPLESGGERLNLPALVIDADGLNLLSQCPNWWEHLPPETIVTPHPGEMARLTGLAMDEIARDRIGVASRFAQQWGCTVILKGAYSVVASRDGRTTLIPFATPALATAGTGDVLAGTLVGLLAQGLKGYEAAICGAYLHGLAGQIAQQDIGRAGVVAGDLLPRLPLAMNQVRGE